MNKGIYFAFLTALISGFAVFFNKFAIGFWASSSVYTTAKNLTAAVFLTSLILVLRKLPELKKLSKKDWLRLVLIGFVGGSIPFLLFFKGLSLTKASSAAFIHKTLFVWIALLALPILKEKLSKLQILALAILGLGAYLFVSPSFSFGYGEILALMATFLWAVENIIAKITLKNISAFTLGWARMFFGSLFLMVYLGFTGNLAQLFVFSGEKLLWLLFVGAILFGYVTTWYSALKRAPATVVSAVLVLAAPITGILNAVFITHQLRPLTVLAIILITTGVLGASKIPFLIKTKYERAFSIR